MGTFTGSCCPWGAGGVGLTLDCSETPLGRSWCHSVPLSCSSLGLPLWMLLCQAAVTAQAHQGKSQSPDRGHGKRCFCQLWIWAWGILLLRTGFLIFNIGKVLLARLCCILV